MSMFSDLRNEQRVSILSKNTSFTFLTLTFGVLGAYWGRTGGDIGAQFFGPGPSPALHDTLNPLQCLW